jgi:hypothetical protein
LTNEINTVTFIFNAEGITANGSPPGMYADAREDRKFS